MASLFRRPISPVWPLLGCFALALSLAMAPSAFAAEAHPAKKKTAAKSSKPAKAKARKEKQSKAPELAKAPPPPPTPIYRCAGPGGDMRYSQFPCATPAPNLTNAAWRDERPAAQVKDSLTIAKREEKLLKTMRRDHARDEKEAIAAHAPTLPKGRQTGPQRQSDQGKSTKAQATKPKRFKALSQNESPPQGLQTP